MHAGLPFSGLVAQVPVVWGRVQKPLKVVNLQSDNLQLLLNRNIKENIRAQTRCGKQRANHSGLFKLCCLWWAVFYREGTFLYNALIFRRNYSILQPSVPLTLVSVIAESIFKLAYVGKLLQIRERKYLKCSRFYVLILIQMFGFFFHNSQFFFCAISHIFSIFQT